jgi:hypothetical protein
MQRVEKAMAARIDALVVLESLKQQEAVINAAYSQLHAKEVSGTMTNADVRRMNRARAEVDQVAQAREAGEAAYAKLRGRNERDLQLYRRDRCSKMAEMVLRYADAQAATNEVVGDVWLSMAHKLGADTATAGPDLAALALGELGQQVSHSAVLPEGQYMDADDSAVADGPIPAEHAAVV